VEPADTIARIGFRRWHERQLLECHAWLVTGILCVLAVVVRIGEHATCRSCGTYGRFEVISPSHVRCRACANEWRLID